MMEYFASHPPSTDKAWSAEMNAVAEFCVGYGLDPGAGERTFSAETVCMDMHPRDGTTLQGDATQLPFATDTFDYVVNSHLLEHLRDTRAVICEWLRVVKPGGHVCCIIPNTEYTHGMNTDKTPHVHEWAPREFVQQVLGFELSAKHPWFDASGALSWAPGEVVIVDEACAHWSFCCVLKKADVSAD